MAKKSKKTAAPLTLDLPQSLLKMIGTQRAARGLDSASAVVRLALDAFDFEGCAITRDPHRQISVRVPAEQRARLKRYAKLKRASVGELVRLALEALPAKPAKKSRG
ncbi:MAG: hypothetical protein RLZZ15_3029 [Verrucomicrobiota bacterium]|jgi:Arc/MetJ-type ribon-helix-helix transcriptional regulator